jgi:SAM-dependent methyltransferase
MGVSEMLKTIVRRLARPFTRRVFARVDARMAPIRDQGILADQELATLRADLTALLQHFGPMAARVQTHDRQTEEHQRVLTDLREQVSAVTDVLPVLLNTISSQNAAAREAKRVEFELRETLAALAARLDTMRDECDARVGDEASHLHKRVDELGAMLAERIGQVDQRGEFIRREMLFELRHGGHDKGVSSVPETRVITPEKLAAADDIRLNLGCGHIPIEGYLNVDGRPLDGVDIVAEAGDLPFEPGTVAAIHSAHMLEHFPVEELRRRLLPYWFGLLRPGGVFSAVVPDAETMIDEYAAGRFPFDDLRLVTFGDQEYDGDFHFNMFSKASICEMLETAGFADVRVGEAGRRNGTCYEMEVAARRPGTNG